MDAQNQYGSTPLHYAVREHNADAVLALLKAGANPHIRDEKDCTTLQMLVGKVISEQDVPIFEYMFEYGINPYELISKRSKHNYFEYLKKHCIHTTTKESNIIDLIYNHLLIN